MAAIGLTIWPSSAFADMGVPMLVFIWPASWILFVPIALVEAAVAFRVLALPFKRCLLISFVANLVSTLLGIPLTWLAVAILEVLLAGLGLGLNALSRGYIPEDIAGMLAILSPAWLGPGDQGPWVFTLASLVLCIPFFFASVYCERWVAKKMVLPALHEGVRHWSWRANLITYSAIAVLLLIATIYLFLRR